MSLFPDQHPNVFFIVRPCASDGFHGPEGDPAHSVGDGLCRTRVQVNTLSELSQCSLIITSLEGNPAMYTFKIVFHR